METKCGAIFMQLRQPGDAAGVTWFTDELKAIDLIASDIEALQNDSAAVSRKINQVAILTASKINTIDRAATENLKNDIFKAILSGVIGLIPSLIGLL